MRKPEFTPRTWYSDDGKWKFMMDRYGITDILPGPNHRLLNWLKANYDHTEKVVKRPYQSGDAHIHWAFPED